mmetsp:Transcript_14078/g.37882  ORF Transcript_14078/g.37882 Transcript_14078/m.37882 type:complete len:607 (+) Transcript_14078:4515-6335(+)
MPVSHVYTGGERPQGPSLAFEGITFAVGEQDILKPMSARVDAGEVVAIIGPSGAGKTSLLNILAGRVTSDSKKRISGRLTLDGKPIDPLELRPRVAYVMQDDSLLPFTTPREALAFSAHLRRAREESKESKDSKVEEMLRSLHLESCADTYIGNDLVKGVSGGERKRTAIGVELVTDPGIVFLDEPTSGLDSYGALSVVQMLREIAADGHLVLCTIHQPSSEIFHLFDRVLLLARGDLVYAGAVPRLAADWLKGGYEMPPAYNPADFVMFKMQTEPQDRLLKVREANASSMAAEGAAGGDSAKANGQVLSSGSARLPLQSKAPLHTQFGFLIRREFRSLLRNVPGLAARVVIPTCLNLLVGVIFLGAGRREDIQTHFGALTQILVGSMFGSAQPVLLEFPTERGVFLCEKSSGSYVAISYFVSKVLLQIPLAFLDSTVAVVVPFWLIGLQGNPILHILTCWALGLASTSSALVLGALSPNAEAAMQTTPLIFVPQLLFAGFFIKIQQIPVWLRWAQYLCALKFGINLALIVEFGECAQSELLEAGSAEAISATEAGQGLSCASLLFLNDVNPAFAWVYGGILVGIYFLFQLIAYLVLTSKANAAIY